MLTLEKLLKKMKKEKLIRHINGKKNTTYNMVNPIFKSSPLQNNTLYVGFVSELNNICVENPDVGFILIRDVPLKECLNIAGELIIWDEMLSFETLFNAIQAEFRIQIDLASSIPAIFSALIKGNSLKELIEIGSKVLNNPIIVTNSSYKVVVMSDVDIDEPAWQFARTHGYCSHVFINTYRSVGISKKVIESEHPVLLTKGIAKDMRVITKKLVIENKIVGYISIHETSRKFIPSDIDTLNVLSSICS